MGEIAALALAMTEGALAMIFSGCHREGAIAIVAISVKEIASPSFAMTKEERDCRVA